MREITEIKKINYKSDFDFILRLRDGAGADIGWPDYDWVARFYTSMKVNAIEVSCIGGRCQNCYNDDGRIHVVMNHHTLSPGILTVEFSAMIPNDTYPDGDEVIVAPESLSIELVREAAPCPSSAEVELMIPYIKGEAFTFEDFTPEQIAQLQKPAQDAADNLEVFVKDAKANEETRERAERVRQQNEQTRQADETSRKTAEQKRIEAETEREENENTRKQAEQERESAEERRAEEFLGFKETIDSKADRFELSPVLGERSLTPETFPDIEIFTREELKMDLFDDLWVALGSGAKVDHYHVEDGVVKPYYLNGIWMTYNEALAVYNAPVLTNDDRNLNYFGLNIRTHRPPRISFGITVGGRTFANSTIEVVSQPLLQPGVDCFNSCTKLRSIHVYNIGSSSYGASAFLRCSALESLSFYGIPQNGVSFSLADSPLISAASLQTLITKTWSNNPGYTITVHPDVYARITAEDKESEWTRLLTDGAAKNVFFATV